MRDLPPMVRVLGHPAVASVLTGGLVLGFLALVQAGPGGIVAALPLLIPAAWVARSAEAVKRQADWRRAWDSMALPRQATPKNWAALVALAMLAGMIWVELGA